MLPARTVVVASGEPEALSAAQPERGRLYVQIRRGVFEGRLGERSDGSVAVSRESWSAPLRVRCARPTSYVAFSAVISNDGATWCGVELGRRSILQLEHDWELTSRAALEASSFAVRRDELEEIERRLAGSALDAPLLVNRVFPDPAAGALVDELRRRATDALAAGPLAPEAQATFRAELLQFAALLRSRGAARSARLESHSRRRAAVRRIEEFLDAHERTLPSIADLCAMAGVSERTLVYAFREQVGVSPGRYLRLRRLNRVRKELRAAAPGGARITDVAMRWGFWQLGRFAGDYLRLFDELPSQTLARTGRARASRAPGLEAALR